MAKQGKGQSKKPAQEKAKAAKAKQPKQAKIASREKPL